MFLQRSALYAVLVPWRAAVPQCRFYELPLRPNGQGGLLGFFAAEHSALPAGVWPARLPQVPLLFLHRYFDVFPVCVPGTKASSAVVCAAVLFQRRVYCSRWAVQSAFHRRRSCFSGYQQLVPLPHRRMVCYCHPDPAAGCQQKVPSRSPAFYSIPLIE